MTYLWCGTASAQEVPAVEQPSQSAPISNPNYTRLIVHPAAGNDKTADGSDRAPFKTITRALEVAQPNTLILLTPGTYTAETGEVFPLKLKAGVTLQGDIATRGQGVVIRGSGHFLSRSFARQNVTILGTNQSALMGVTVTNPSPQGYGVWIESGSLIVTDNTLTANTHDGISVVGNATPIIRNNYFYQNGANGITIYGVARPIVHENIFEQTGFAINTSQDSAPLIIGNRITQNKDGIVVQVRSRPIVRQNSVESNERDGLVAIAQAQPDLGTAAEPGNNLFRNNRQFDVNVKAAEHVIAAAGNEMTKTVGQLDTTATGVIASPPLTSRPSAPIAVTPNAAPVAFGQPLATENAARSTPTASPSRITLNVPTAPVKPVTQPSSELSAASFPIPKALQSSTAPAPSSRTSGPPRQLSATPSSPPRLIQTVSFAAPIPAPTPVPSQVPLPPLRDSSRRELPLARPRLLPLPPRATAPLRPIRTLKPLSTAANLPFKVPTSTQPIVIPVPAPEFAVSAAPPVQPAAPPPSSPRGSSVLPEQKPANLLPVPGPNAPLGNTGNKSSVPIYRSSRQEPDATGTVSQVSASTARYRVVVEADSDRQQDAVRAMVPGAFRTFLKGRMVVQVAAYSDRAKADDLIQQLAQQGIRALVEPLD